MTGVVARSRALVVIDEQAGTEAARAQRRRRRNSGLADRGSGLLNRALFGLAVVAALLIGLGGWGATAQLSGAVIASGRMVVDSNVKPVQHPAGGVVGTIRVRNGQRVERGEVLLTIDDSKARTVAAINTAKLIQLESERARLVAERDNSSAMEFPTGLDSGQAVARRAFEEEQRLLDSRRRGWRTQQMRLSERVTQMRREIDAISVQRSAKEREIELIRQELKLVDDLHKRQLTNIVRLIGMKREIARFEGEKGALDAQIARAESSIAEIELQRVELEQRIVADGQKQLREIDTELSELRERRIASDEDVQRTEVRAPSSGIVHELAAHTVGGVIMAGATIMKIVPERELLAAEVRISPNDIDQVRVGQRALVRFAAFSREQTAESWGRVQHIGADMSRDPSNGREYFLARIAVTGDQQDSPPTPLALAPGMPLDAFIETETRTALSYLLKPVSDHLARAFRER